MKVTVTTARGGHGFNGPTTEKDAVITNGSEFPVTEVILVADCIGDCALIETKQVGHRLTIPPGQSVRIEEEHGWDVQGISFQDRHGATWWMDVSGRAYKVKPQRWWRFRRKD